MHAPSLSLYSRSFLSAALALALAAPALAAQTPFDCATATSAHATAVQKAQDALKPGSQGGSGTTPFDVPEESAQAANNCMVDFASSVNGVVGSGTLGSMIDLMVKKMDSAACSQLASLKSQAQQAAQQKISQAAGAVDPSQIAQSVTGSTPPASFNFSDSLHDYVTQQVAAETKAAEAKAAAAAAQQGNPDMWSALGNILAGKTAGGLPVNPYTSSGGN